MCFLCSPNVPPTTRYAGTLSHSYSDHSTYIERTVSCEEYTRTLTGEHSNETKYSSSICTSRHAAVGEYMVLGVYHGLRLHPYRIEICAGITIQQYSYIDCRMSDAWSCIRVRRQTKQGQIKKNKNMCDELINDNLIFNFVSQ